MLISRDSLKCLRIEKDYTVATNGKSLALVTFDRDSINVNEQIEPCSIELNKINKDVFVDVTATNSNGHIVLESLDGSQSHKIPKIEYQNYPDVQDVLPKNIDDDYVYHEHLVNIDYLISLLKVAKEVSDQVRIAIPKNYAAINLSAGNDVQSFRGLLMPIRE